MADTLSKMLRAMTILLVMVLLGLLTYSVRQLTEVVILQRSVVEATINVAGDRCKIDERLEKIERRLYDLDPPGAE